MALDRSSNGVASDALTRYLDEIGRIPLLSADEEVALAQEMENGRLAERALEEASTATERRRLERAVRGGEHARRRFLESNLRLVVSVAKRYRNTQPGVDFLDLIQEGNLGLVRAVEKFEWRRGFKFSTYATWWIRQAISRALLEKGRPIRVPLRIHDAMIALTTAAAQLQAERGRAPTAGELAERSGVAVGVVEEALAVAQVTSLEAPVGEDGAVMGDFVQVDDEPGPEEAAVQAGISRELMEAIDRLGERERLIVRNRFGFNGNDPMTRAELGRLLGLTPERIGQLEKRALTRLRHPSFGLLESELI